MITARGPSIVTAEKWDAADCAHDQGELVRPYVLQIYLLRLLAVLLEPSRLSTDNCCQLCGMSSTGYCRLVMLFQLT